MPGSRSQRLSPASPIAPAALYEVIDALHRPAHFVLANGMRLEWCSPLEMEESWEVFRGRLLDPAHTRERCLFRCWNVYQIDQACRSSEPLLSVKLDMEHQNLHVVRALYCRVWEGYEDVGNVFLSRETEKWVRELVGSIAIAGFDRLDELEDELRGLMFTAVVGTSRLPLNSLEAPLPAFSLGKLFWLRCREDEVSSGEPNADCLNTDLTWRERAKMLEFLIRATAADQIAGLANNFAARWQSLGLAGAELPRLLRTIFNEIALSPFTDFAPKCLAFVRTWQKTRILRLAEHADFLGWLLRQLGRHLTAYDLVKFHHRGANYPDALLLDAVLREYAEVLSNHSELWGEEGSSASRLRRRAFLHGWYHRQRCEGLPVPDAPTSPGENQRILPAPFVRVAEEQILNLATRTRHLFAEEPLSLDRKAQAILRLAIRDLLTPTELLELGTAVFVERPLGTAKAPAEPDQTPLLAHEAFSLSIAIQRLRYLKTNQAGTLESTAWQELETRLADLGGRPGLRLSPPYPPDRPGSVSIWDAAKVADDFVFLHTLPQSRLDFFGAFDFGVLDGSVPIDWLAPGRKVLIVSVTPAQVAIYDDGGCKRLLLRVVTEHGYRHRSGRELPVGGLEVVGYWEPDPMRDSPIERRWPPGVLNIAARS